MEHKEKQQKTSQLKNNFTFRKPKMIKKIWFLIFGIIFGIQGSVFATDAASQNEENTVTTATNSTTANTSSENFGIDLNSKNAIEGTATFSIYDALGIKKDRAPGERTSVMNYVQDIVLGATTFIWTVVTLALILSGLLYVFSSVDSSLKSKAKSGMKYALIGMVVVMLSLVIIRLVQFLARGGS